MRAFIKKLLREELLRERLTDVYSDVDLLYDFYFRKDIDEINKTGKYTKNLFNGSSTNTSILKSKESIDANRTNPCEIFINHGENNYKPFVNQINLSVSFFAINQLQEYGGNMAYATDEMDYGMARRFETEFSEEKIKGTIHHELAHWVDDSLNNGHISSYLKKQNNGKEPKQPIKSTKIEIQGQIHNIKHLYEKNKDIWDDLMFKEMIDMLPNLRHVYYSLHGETRTQWIRDIKTRMHREGLLGDNMG